jgi:CRISPR/Cas system-associated exonuclease Cas4 (RecB family)
LTNNPYKNLAKLIQNAQQNQSPEDAFLQALNSAISKYSKLNDKPPSQSYKPSMLGGCLREIYFTVTGAPEDDVLPDPNLVGMGESGTDRHLRLQTVISEMKKMGFKDVEWIDVEEFLKFHPVEGTEVVERKGMEVKLRNTIFNMSFMCDGIIKFRGVYYVLEIKTETSFKWQPRTGPEPKAVVQASSYSLCLGVNKVMFVYENRDVCSKKVYIHQVSEIEKYDLVVHKIEECNTYVETDTVPPKSDNKNDCRYCDYKQECKKY